MSIEALHQDRRPLIQAAWLYATARESQLIAGEISVGQLASRRALNVALRDRLPAPATLCGRYVAQGLGVSARRSLHFVGKRKPLDSPLAFRAAAVLEGCPAGRWTVEALARELLTNRTRLAAEFKAAYGITELSRQYRRSVSAGSAPATTTLTGVSANTSL